MSRSRDSAPAAVPTPLPSRELIFPLAVFVALVAFKLLFVTRTAYGPFWGDEVLYRYAAGELLAHGFYHSTHYPLLYPLTLVPALLASDTFRGVVSLNAVYSSLLVLPAYLLARQVVERTPAMLATFVVALLPFHFTYPRVGLSENVFYPLLLLVVWLFVRRRRRLWASDVLAGLALGALWMTRHITIVVAPALLVVWWLRELRPAEGDGAAYDASPSRWPRFAALLAATAAAYAPWLVMQATGGAGIGEILGFGVSVAGGPVENTPAGLGFWIVAYAAAYALIASPFLGVLGLTPIATRREGMRSTYTHLVAAVALVAVGLFVASARHSWLQFYNYPEPTKLMARYAECLVAPLAIVAVGTLVRVIPWRGRRTTLAVLAVVVPTAVVTFGYLVLIRAGGVVPVVSQTAPDVQRLHYAGRAFLVVAPLFFAAIAMLAARARPTLVTSVFTAGAVVLALWGMPALVSDVAEYQSVIVHGRRAGQAYAAGDEPMRVYVDAEVLALSETWDDPLAGTYFRNAARFDDRGRPIWVTYGPAPTTPQRERIWALRLAEGSGSGQVVTAYEHDGHSFELVEVLEPSRD